MVLAHHVSNNVIDPKFDINTIHEFSEAISFYHNHGFMLVNVPWMIPDSNYTKNHNKPLTEQQEVWNGFLVNSPECSFAYLHDQHPGYFKVGQGYQAWTPCFRLEEKYDDQHPAYFLKLDLFEAAESFEDAEDKMKHLMQAAKGLFMYLGAETVTSSFVPEHNEITIGLMFEGVELGSYGVRQTPNGQWYAYGTGLTQPRFGLAVEKHLSRLESDLHEEA